MKKFTSILVLLVIIAVVSVSGCIHYVGQENDSVDITDINNSPENNLPQIEKINKSGNIKIANQSTTNAIKQQNQNNSINVKPKISKEEIETQIIQIIKNANSDKDFTANATLIYIENKPVYIVDIYDSEGWFGYLEVDADNGPTGNSQEGYSFNGGAFRDEVNDKTNVENTVNTPGETQKNGLNNTTELLPENEVKNLLDKELKNNYSIENPDYTIEKFNENDTDFYNVTIDALNQSSNNNITGNATINAKTGEIISLDITEVSEKIYSVDEAGDYVDIVYKGTHVSVRENYPYYSPQNDKVYYSQEEEAEDLYQLSLDME